jgi:CIC family chloride channel protein
MPEQNQDSSALNKAKRLFGPPAPEEGAWQRYRRRSIRLFVYAALIGLVAALGAWVFRAAIELFHELFWPAGGTFLEQARAMPWWLMLLAPAAAGLVTGPLIHYLAPEARGPGVPEVILAVTQRQSVIRHRVTALKALITSLLIGAGASVGREGPIVQIGASVGSSIARLLRLTREERRLCLAAGAAAGIAATFNAPLAGTLFALEIILMDIELAYLSHILVASITGSVLARQFWGEFRVFEAMGFQLATPWELPVYLVLGVLAGCLAIAFQRSVFGAADLFGKVGIPEWTKPALGGLALGGLGIYLPEILGVGYDTVNTMLACRCALGMSLLFIAAKIAATSLCLGSGMSGGVFAPSLFVGAALGTVVGLTAQGWFPGLGLDPSNYTLVGMGAVVSGMTLAPITAVLTIFELTYSYEIILPIMLASISATAVVRLFFGYSVYELKLLRHGHNIVRGQNVRLLRSLTAEDYMRRTFETIRDDAEFTEVVERLSEASYPHFPVLNEHERLVGFLSLSDLRKHLVRFEESKRDIRARDVMSTPAFTVELQHDLEHALTVLEEKGIGALPVVEPFDTEKVVGLLTKDDIIRAYEEKVFKERLLSVPLR